MKNNPNIIVQFIPVGSGEALRKASLGAVDMVFSHAPNLEKKYIDNGVLIDGEIFAYNYFAIVGPIDASDQIKNVNNSIEAMIKIYELCIEGKAVFISRGDNSGTHQRELLLWELAGIKPSGNWYIEVGLGMTETLLIANEKDAYTLTDLGTFYKLKREGKLQYLNILITGEDVLINIYSVYLVNPAISKGIKYELAKNFKEFIISEGLKIIKSFGVDEFGVPLFYPADNFSVKSELREKWKVFAGGYS